MIKELGSVDENIKFLKETVSKLTREMLNKDEKIKELQKQLNTGGAQNTESNVKLKFEKYDNTDEKAKAIVKLYAQGYSSGFIFTMLNKELGITASVNEIQDIIKSIDGDKLQISNDLLEYYTGCRKAFEDQSSLSKGLFAQTIYKKLSLLEEKYSYCLVRAEENEDEKEMRMTLDSLLKLEEKRASIFSKNVLDLFNQNKKQENTYSEDYKKLKEKYLGTSEDKKKILQIPSKIKSGG